MIDVLLYDPTGRRPSLGTDFRVTYVNDLSEIMTRVDAITVPTVVMSSDYSTHPVHLYEVVTHLIATVPAGTDVVLLAPYQLICSQLLPHDDHLMRVTDWRRSSLKGRGELYFPSVTASTTDDIITVLATMPPPLRYRFAEVNHLEQYTYDNPCHPGKPSPSITAPLPLMLLIILAFLIILVLGWMAIQLR